MAPTRRRAHSARCGRARPPYETPQRPRSVSRWKCELPIDCRRAPVLLLRGEAPRRRARFQTCRRARLLFFLRGPSSPHVDVFVRKDTMSRIPATGEYRRNARITCEVRAANQHEGRSTAREVTRDPLGHRQIALVEYPMHELP